MNNNTYRKDTNNLLVSIGTLGFASLVYYVILATELSNYDLYFNIFLYVLIGQLIFLSINIFLIRKKSLIYMYIGILAFLVLSQSFILFITIFWTPISKLSMLLMLLPLLNVLTNELYLRLKIKNDYCMVNPDNKNIKYYYILSGITFVFTIVCIMLLRFTSKDFIMNFSSLPTRYPLIYVLSPLFYSLTLPTINFSIMRLKEI